MESVNINNRVNAVSNAYNQNNMNKTSSSAIEERKDGISQFTGLQGNVKAETESIKSVNELFGALKKSEKTVIKMEKIVESGTTEGVKDLLETTYKDEKILFNVPLKEGSYNSGAMIEKDLENPEALKKTLNEVKETITKDLEEVKQEMLGRTSTMGTSAQSNIDNSGISLDLSTISKSSNMEYLKQQMKGLLE